MRIAQGHRSGLVVIFALSLVLAQAAAALGAKPDSRTSQPASNDHYVVAFKDKPVVTYDGGIRDYRATAPERGEGFDAHSPKSVAYADYLRGVHGDYVRWLHQRAPEVEVVRDLVLAANAIALRLNGADPKLLSQGPGVKYTTKSNLYRPTMDSSVDLIGAPDAWGTLAGGRDGAGTGIKVGVIDSGIDDSHPFIADCRDPEGDGVTTVTHQYFVSGDTTGLGEVAKWGTPDDELLVSDHGTHVAGTIGGCVVDDALDGILGVAGVDLTGEVMSGVAPGVELHDYNVFPGFGAGYVAYGGSAFSHDIGAAIEQALADSMDVINMSLGGGVQGPHDWLAEVVNDASAAMVVAVSAGNSGNGGDGDYGTIGSPGSAAGALTVGASTNSRSIGFPVQVTDAENGNWTYAAAVGDFDPFAVSPVTNVGFALWPEQADADGDGELEGLACTRTSAPDQVKGKVVLIDRGACTFSLKVANAAAAEAIGVIVANNVPEDGPIAMAGEGDLPAVGISYESGRAIRVLDDPWRVTIDGNTLEMSPTEPNRVAGFSSRGPAPFTRLVKPDIVAPGVNIRSSVFEGAYSQFQGTSMAAPHAAGAAALVMQALREAEDYASPKQVKGLLVAAADRQAVSGESLGVLDRGNGLLNVGDAVTRTAWADPVSISFGVTTGGRNVSGTAALAIHGDGCSVTSIPDEYVTYAGGVVSMDAGRAPTGQYEGDLLVDCGTETFTVPWWFEIDGRGSR
jgi:minor extracellular serine protease Vpr